MPSTKSKRGVYSAAMNRTEGWDIEDALDVLLDVFLEDIADSPLFEVLERAEAEMRGQGGEGDVSFDDLSVALSRALEMQLSRSDFHRGRPTSARGLILHEVAAEYETSE